MIPRSVRRMFDERGEPREQASDVATIKWRGASLAVELVNVSASGAMVLCGEIPHIGETIALQLRDRRSASGVVSWVRDGHIGIHFTAPLK